MKDQIPNQKNNEEVFSGALRSMAEEIQVNSGFKTNLEEQLMQAHRPTRVRRLFSTFHGGMPTLGWLAALAFMILMLNWVIRTIAPPPVPAAQETSTTSSLETPSPIPTRDSGNHTPMPDDAGYDWRGAKLFLAQPLPAAPAEANVYQLKKDQQITPEEARALAGRFGLTGEMYASFDYVFNVDDYYFTDGKQVLQVYSNRRFTYIADLARVRTVNKFTPVDEAEQVIRDWLRSRGFDYPFKVTPSIFFGGYNVKPLMPDGLTAQYESFTFPPMLIQFDERGEVFSVEATLIDYEPAPLGTYGIISAQEALEIWLNDSEQVGKQDFFQSAENQQPKEWYRDHPDDERVSVYGYAFSIRAGNPNVPPFITIDGVPAVGNTAGLEQLEPSTLIQATGQYDVENGIRRFNVETWNTNIVEEYVEGSLRREGDQIILTSRDGSGSEYLLLDPAADLPLDTDLNSSLLAVSGVIVNGQMDWFYIQFYEDTTRSGGGGGGGGLGFYQLNLSGTPIPFPSPTAQTVNTGGTYIVQENDTLASIASNYGVSIEELAQANKLPDTNLIYVGQALLIPGLENSTGQRLDNVRGFLSISIHTSADGSPTTAYLLVVSDSNTQTVYELDGPNLSELDRYNSLPIIVSGTLRQGAFTPSVSLDHYEIPFPDLQFQIVRGTQQVQEIEGQVATLFTTESGQTYVEFQAFSGELNFSIIGREGDLIQQEVLIVPDETFASYPVIRVFSAGMTTSPKDGQPLELPLTANQIPVYDALGNPEDLNTPRPSLTIESVELEYFVNNPYSQVSDPNYERRSTYIQPVWHFQGHYENGDSFDMLVQALKREFLSPELSPGITPG